jgi:hypothetical protein
MIKLPRFISEIDLPSILVLSTSPPSELFLFSFVISSIRAHLSSVGGRRRSLVPDEENEKEILGASKLLHISTNVGSFSVRARQPREEPTLRNILFVQARSLVTGICEGIFSSSYFIVHLAYK